MVMGDTNIADTCNMPDINNYYYYYNSYNNNAYCTNCMNCSTELMLIQLIDVFSYFYHFHFPFDISCAQFYYGESKSNVLNTANSKNHACKA